MRIQDLTDYPDQISTEDYFIVQKPNSTTHKITFKALLANKTVYCNSCGAPTQLLTPCKYCDTHN